MKTTSWPPADPLEPLNEVTYPKYQQEPAWLDTVQFEYHLVLVVAAIICILAVARLMLMRKQ